MTRVGEFLTVRAGCVFVLFIVLMFAASVHARTGEEKAPPPSSASERDASPPLAGGGVTLQASVIQARAESYVRSLVPEYIEVESMVWSGLVDLKDLAPDAELNFRPMARFTWFGPQRLALDVTRGGERVRRLWLTFEVRGQARVACAARDIAAGSALDSADIEVGSVPLTQIPVDFATDPTSLVGRKLSRRYRTGEPLSARHVAKIPDVRRGDKVSVLVGNARFQVQATGVAQEDGSVGEVIFVRNTASGKTFLARVVGTHRVEVVL
ncbi:MAG: flagellar basal body P-ring formation protein FlgA [Nitrospirae bacterium]|nr:flagellar basal body P-ring formation protein FlgA [Nitrospirota bacterium]